MANYDLDLPAALRFAKKAVQVVGEQSMEFTLDDMDDGDLQSIFKVAAVWDTMGWVNERMSNYDVAEQYLRAAWKMTQDGMTASHLCQLYAAMHNASGTSEMCRLTVYRLPLSQTAALSEYQSEIDTAKANLDSLVGGRAKPTNPTDAADVVIRERTFKLPRFLTGTESAEFFVLLESDGSRKPFKVKETKFISGSEKMRLQGKHLEAINFNVPAPSETPTRFVRRGILGCYQYTGCSFVLLDPATVHSAH